MQLEKLISKKHLASYQELLMDLSYLEDEFPYLATIGVDSERLGEALLSDLKENHPTAYIELTTKQPTQELYRLWHDDYKDLNCLIIMPIYKEEMQDEQLAAEQLLWHRDIVTRNKLQIIVVVKKGLYSNLLTKGYDFISYSNFSDQFLDQAAQIEMDLNPNLGVSFGEEAFQDAKKELEEYLGRKGPKNKEILMRRYYNAAKTSYRISYLDQAKDFYEEALRLADELESDEFLSQILDKIGSIYHKKGDFEEALKLYNRALEIDNKVGDLKGVGEDLSHIGLIYYTQGKLDKALDYLKKAIQIHRSIGYNYGVGKHLGHIGLIHFDRGALDRSREFHQRALNIHRKVGSFREEAIHLGNLGLIYRAKKQFKEALQYHKKALEIDQRIGYLQGQGEDLFNIGDIYFDFEELTKALQYYNEARQIFEKMGVQSQLEQTLKKISEIEEKLN